MKLEEQRQRKEILRKYLDNPELSHSAISYKLGMVQSTVSRVLNQCNNRLTIDRKKKSVQSRSLYSVKDHKRSFQAFKRNPNSSVSDAARKLHLSKT